MSTLIENLISWFPILNGCPGAARFDPEAMDDWAVTLPHNSQSRHAARFVLSVYADQPWKCGKFDAVEALRVWGHSEIVGYVRWSQVPYMLSANWPGRQVRPE